MDVAIDFRGAQRVDSWEIPFVIDSLVFDPELFILSEAAVVQQLSGLQTGSFHAQVENGNLQLQLPFDLQPGAVLRVIDVQGRQLYEFQPETGRLYHEIPLAGWLQPGMYLVQLQDASGQVVRRVIL